MSIHDIPTTYNKPVTAFKIERIKNKWQYDLHRPNTRIMNMTAGDPGLMDRAPHVDPILRSLFVFNINVNIPAPFALILELAGGGNSIATKVIFLRTLEQMPRHFGRDDSFTMTPFDWSHAWSLGPPVYGDENRSFTNGINEEIDNIIMYELADYPDKYISMLDYKWYWIAKIWGDKWTPIKCMAMNAMRSIGPHNVETYKKLGPGTYEHAGTLVTGVVPKLRRNNHENSKSECRSS